MQSGPPNFFGDDIQSSDEMIPPGADMSTSMATMREDVQEVEAFRSWDGGILRWRTTGSGMAGDRFVEPGRSNGIMQAG